MYRDASTCSLCGEFVQTHEADIVPEGLRCRRCTLAAIGTEGSPTSAVDRVETMVLNAVGSVLDGVFSAAASAAEGADSDTTRAPQRLEYESMGRRSTVERLEHDKRQLGERIAHLEVENRKLQARVQELSALLLLQTGKPG